MRYYIVSNVKRYKIYFTLEIKQNIKYKKYFLKKKINKKFIA
jgi:hypothetical protein